MYPDQKHVLAGLGTQVIPRIDGHYLHSGGVQSSPRGSEMSRVFHPIREASLMPHLCLVGQKTRLIHSSPMTIYLTPQTGATLITNNFILYHTNSWNNVQRTNDKSADVKTIKLEQSLRIKVYFRTGDPQMFSQRVPVTGRQVLLTGQELKTCPPLSHWWDLFSKHVHVCCCLFVCDPSYSRRKRRRMKLP